MTNGDKKVLKEKFENNKYKFDNEIYEKITNALEERYTDESEIITNIIQKFPNNTNLTEVYAKVVIVNTTHNAGVNRIHCVEVAKDIVKFDKFDKRLKNGDITLVDELIEETHKNKKIGKYQWSFYPKYLTCHNDKFSKYDSYVGDYVKKRSKLLGLEKFEKCIGKFYENYYNTITKIIEEDGFPDRQTFDKFIWALYKK